jgi:radical SAM superfamily enzyme YgiQ (UPF0313 family)
MPTSPQNSYAGWFDHTYPYLTGHGLWLRGNEINTLPASEYDHRPFRVLIARLSTYYDTAESFSHKVLYQIARKRDALFPDFAFLPPVNDAPLFERDSIPWLLGTGTKRGPNGFDLVAFSNAIVQELINVPVMLERSGIPLAKSARLADPSAPLVILGGSNALHASVFFTPDPPVDGIFVGESTACISRLFLACADAKRRGLSKQETLGLLEEVPGFVQPDKPRPTRRVCDAALDLNTLLSDAPVFNLEHAYGTGNLQLSEGCPCFCSFCSESFCRKPYREVPADEIAAQAGTMKAGMGLDKVELYSFNFNMHSEIRTVLEHLGRLFPSVGLKSQRFDPLARDPFMTDLLHAVGKTSLTCGLEGISPRLRRYLHKSLAEDDLRASMAAILSSQMRELKIFLIVTGKEEEADFAEFEAFLRFIEEKALGEHHAPRIIFSATPLVRFPWTPLEFEDAPVPEALRPLIASTRRGVERHGFEFRLSSDLNDYHLSQILARASHPALYPNLLCAIRTAGYVYRRSVPASFVDAFIESCCESGIPHEALLAGPSPQTAGAPWLNVETGVTREFLVRQHESAQAMIDNGYCLGAAGVAGSCKSCGVCDEDARRTVCAPRHETAHVLRASKDGMRQAQASAEKVSFLVDVGDSCRGLPRQVVCVALARALMTACPESIPLYRGYARSFWSDFAGPCWITGSDIITLAWERPAVEMLANLAGSPAGLAAVKELLGERAELAGMGAHEPSKFELSISSPYPIACGDYFIKRGLTHTLRKTAPGTYACEFTKQALKKNAIYGFWYRLVDGGGVECGTTVTPKFDVPEFVREAFTYSNGNDWVRTRVKATFPARAD